MMYSVNVGPTSVDASDPGPDEPPLSSCAGRVAWSFSVQAHDVFILCRALLVCDEVDVRRCTAVCRHGKARVRVDITLRAEHTGTVLHHVMQHVNDAEVGRTRLLGIS